MMKKASKGFTLIELMIVVAIIGILAAIAIPNFLRYQLRSRASERRLNLEAIFKSQEALRQSEAVGRYNTIVPVPASANTEATLTNTKVPWLAVDLGVAQSIDWIVQGSTYGVYNATATATGNAMAACGVTDIDADDVNAADALWNPQLAPDGTVPAAGVPPVACGAIAPAIVPAAAVHASGLTYAHGVSPMGRPQGVTANSTF